MLPRSNHRYSLRSRKPASMRPTSTYVTATLPTEIILEVIEYVKENHDFSSFYSYSLISCDWIAAMRSILFTGMTITFNELNKFIDLLRSPCCSLTPHVRELCIRQVPAWDVLMRSNPGPFFGNKSFRHYAGRVSQVVQLLPNVTQLCLQDFDFPSLGRKFRHKTYADFDQIETLVLRNGVCEATPFAIEEVLSSFPRVRRLECDILGLVDAKTKVQYSNGLPQRPSAEYLPELTELLIVVPQADFLTLLSHCVSLQNVQRLDLNYKWGDSLPQDEIKALCTMMRLIGPSLEYLTFGGRVDELVKPNLSWDFKHNANLHTLMLGTSGISPSYEFGGLMNVMNICNLRTLVLSILVGPMFCCCRDLQALQNHDNVYGRLEKLQCNVRTEVGEAREEIIETLRNKLDPGGRRRWWERGILKIIISYY